MSLPGATTARLAAVYAPADRDDAADAAFGLDRPLSAIEQARRAQLAAIRNDPAYDPFEDD